MFKKGTIVIFAVLCSLCVFSVHIRNSLQNEDIMQESNNSKLLDLKFQFFGVFKESNLPVLDDMKIMVEESAYILNVIPTGKSKVVGSDILQEVKIDQCIKGNEIIDEKIWIASHNGFWYKKETDIVYNWGRTNLMWESVPYVVILDTVQTPYGTYYYNEFPLGAIRCDTKETYRYVDILNEHSYSSLKEYEFFAEDENTLKKIYELKEDINAFINGYLK